MILHVCLLVCKRTEWLIGRNERFHLCLRVLNDSSLFSTTTHTTQSQYIAEIRWVTHKSV